MRRPGHHRPVGTVAAPWTLTWHDGPGDLRGPAEPLLGDITFETALPGGDPGELRRAYLIVGVEDLAPNRFGERRFRVHCERLDYDDALRRADGHRLWHHYRHRG